MALIVQKFGGTSVGTPEKIRLVAERISRSHAEGHQLVVVVSAMGDTTDELIDLAHRVSQSPPHREMDMLLTAGERISMSLLSMALADFKVPALSLTGSQSGIITDESHRRARIRRILGNRVRSALAEGKVVIVAGFQGVSETKEITTLGRGGSDTSAVALAAVLKAEVCEIFTDVDGVYSADPRIVSNAKLWRTLPHPLMVEMATRGAGVLHPRSVELAKQFGVRLCVRNSFSEDLGTTLVKDLTVEKNLDFALAKGKTPIALTKESRMEEFAVTGVTADRNKLLITVYLSRPTVLGALWSRAAHFHLSIVAPVFSNGEVRFFSDRDGETEWKKALDELVIEGFITKYELHSKVVPLSVVGDRFSQDGSALHEVISVLAREQIDVTLGSASALAITVGIPLSRIDEGVRVLHSEFFKAEGS